MQITVNEAYESIAWPRMDEDFDKGTIRAPYFDTTVVFLWGVIGEIIWHKFKIWLQF